MAVPSPNKSGCRTNSLKTVYAAAVTQATVLALAWLVIGLLCVYGAIKRKEYSGLILAWAFFLFTVFVYAHE